MSEENLWDLETSPPANVVGAALSIGNFDGVHVGHHRLIAMLRAQARTLKVPGVAVSFEPHPLVLLRPESAPIPLTTPARRSELLRMAGVDQVLTLHTTNELLGMNAEDFFRRILVEKLEVKGIVEGGNFGFGKGRTGNVATLRRLCDEFKIAFESAMILESDKFAISSTSIRESLKNGDVQRAALLLGRPHRITGTVVLGDRRGRTIGVPTANLSEINVAIPQDGVYAVQVHHNGQRYAGACNVGPVPSFGIVQPRFEVHILDFAEEIYGQHLDVDFIARIRETRTFASLEALKTQLAADITQAKELCSKQLVEESKTARERSLTIAEWLRWKIEPTLAESSGQLHSAQWEESGKLHIEWKLTSPAAPHDVYQLLFHLENDLRRIFPEVNDIVQASLD